MDIPHIIQKVEPKYVASSKKVGHGQILEEWYSDEDAVPKWWDSDFHMLVEFTPGTFSKFCMKHNKRLPESGCSNCILEKGDYGKGL